MRKTFLSILGIALTCFILTTQQSSAIVYDQFQQVTTRHFGLSPLGYLDFQLPSDPVNDPTLPITSWVVTTFRDGYGPAGYDSTQNDFRVYPNARRDHSLDDGYATAPLGFTYRYNGVDYTQVYVSINGFVTFGTPRGDGLSPEPPANAELARNPQWLFQNSPGGGMPVEVIAPYWGDHKYWQNDLTSVIEKGWAPTRISYVNGKYQKLENGVLVERNFIIIQWRDLNVNWRDINGPGDTTYYKGNVTSFQLVIYEGEDNPTALQGDVEFRYNTLGPHPWQGNVITRPNNRGAVGIKGSNIGIANRADFINAIYNGSRPEFPANQFFQQNYDSMALGWPIVDVGRAIVLVARHSILGDTTWGDGDADMSSKEGGRHIGLPQNRFVTLNDARVIMRSVVTQVPLDSLYKQAAFHADVDHNGRYYYLTSRDAGIHRVSATNRDTFWVRKVGAFEGGFGFNPHYGENANFMEIDFYDLGGVPLANSKRTVRVLDPGNNLQRPNFDYELQVVLMNPADSAGRAENRELFWRASEPSVNSRIEQIRIRIKKSIVWKDSLITDRIENLPWISSPKTQIFYEANERDASVILSYLGAKIPSLPWIYENPVFNGKITVPYQFATNLMFDNARTNSNNEVVIPIYFNGIAENAQSAVFNLNANIVNLESASSDVLVDFATNRAVIIADGYFAPNTPIAYLTVENTSEILATDVRFDGKNAADISFKLNAVENDFVNNLLAQNSPNPVVNTTTFEFTVVEAGNYSLVIYDLSGNVVKEIANGYFTVGKYPFNWDVTNSVGEKVVDGTYIYRLNGDNNTSVSKKLVVIR